MGPGLRERKKEQTRRAIVTAALDLFEARGYDATTVEEIAEAANVSSRTLFRYFDSKVEIMCPVGESDGDEMADLEELAARPASESPVDALLHIVREQVLHSVTDELAFRQLRFAMSEPNVQALTAERLRRHLVPAFAVRLGVDETDFGARVVAGAFAETLLVGVSEWVRRGADARTLDETITHAFEALRDGVAGAST